MVNGQGQGNLWSSTMPIHAYLFKSGWLNYIPSSLSFGQCWLVLTGNRVQQHLKSHTIQQSLLREEGFCAKHLLSFVHQKHNKTAPIAAFLSHLSSYRSFSCLANDRHLNIFIIEIIIFPFPQSQASGFGECVCICLCAYTRYIL